ncbi:gamma-glutamyl hydrolase-like isoform X2 [Chelonus insularis]|uniref:gamma-glutamyl hydrolase-like isoform X2 n=1 Tax=Chelonus insularis TaxID=460826 RepID=UPI0015889A12|nr:gamma-glutamyl hydrolase-like isoform X2 [Chelonus insularis]
MADDNQVRCPVGPNERPIIGILAQEASHRMKSLYNGTYKTYIAASYVKFLESGGAQVVPIWQGKDVSYYENILRQINGVVLPGGSAYFNTTNGYADSARIIYRIATDINLSGTYFPLWGACLGFEVMTYIAAGDQYICKRCYGMNNVASPLEFKSDYRTRRLFKHAPSEIIEILNNENVTANFHHYCVTEEDFAKVGLSNTYRVVTINRDSRDTAFISTMEHDQYPFYGVQYHPEKNSFEWADRLTGIPHSSNAIKVSQYFANFIVDEARKNFNSFRTKDEEKESLIYNYEVTYTSSPKSSFTQCYLFEW